jgi:signal transduction histidine kinase
VVKYGGGTEVTLTAETGRIVVAVEDRGPGIPCSAIEKVFEPFYRIEVHAIARRRCRPRALCRSHESMAAMLCLPL